MPSRRSVNEIFLSHHSGDSAAALRLRDSLVQRGYATFLAVHPDDGIRVGEEWEKTLYHHLRRCRALVALCSAAYFERAWCIAEITHARALGKPVFLVRLEDCELPDFLRDRQVGDLTDGRFDAGLDGLWRGFEQAGLDPADTFTWSGDGSPYPGLCAFEAADAPLFFGRDRAVRDLLARLRQMQHFGTARLTAVLGASGSGKSSLLRAGVLPHLRRDRRWLVLGPLRPLHSARETLAATARALVAELGCAADTAAAFVAAVDRLDARGVREALGPLRQASGVGAATLLLAIDQFEELLDPAGGDRARGFLQFLAELLDGTDDSCLAVCTLRSDFLKAFQADAVTCEFELETYTVPAMTLADLESVVEQPAELAGLLVEPGIARTLAEETGSNDALPLLAFTLRELWDDRAHATGRLALADYDAIGRIAGAVRKAAEAAFARAGAEAGERELRDAFLSMVRPNEDGQRVRRPLEVNRLSAAVGGALEQHFVRRRLLVRTEDRLEIAHESLLRTWDRLVAWIDDAEPFFRWLARVNTRRGLWEKSREDDDLLPSGMLEDTRHWLAAERAAMHAEEVAFAERSVAWHVRAGGNGAAASDAIAFELGVRARNELRNDAHRAVELGLESVDATGSPRALVDLRHILAESPLLATLAVGAGRASCARFSPDGTRVAVGGDDGALRVWDGDGRALLFDRREHDDAVADVRWSIGGERLVSSGRDGLAVVWNTATCEVESRYRHGFPLVTAALSDPLGMVVAAGEDRGVYLWALADERSPKRVLPHGDPVVAAMFSAAGLLVTRETNGDVLIWDPSTTAAGRRLPADRPRGPALELSMAGKVSTCDGDTWVGSERVLRSWFKPLVQDAIPQPGSARRFRVDAHGNLVLAGGAGAIQLQSDVVTIRGSADRRWLLSLGRDGRARLWNTSTLAVVATFAGPTPGAPACFAFAADSQRLLVPSPDGGAVLIAATPSRRVRSRHRLRGELPEQILLAGEGRVRTASRRGRIEEHDPRHSTSRTVCGGGPHLGVSEDGSVTLALRFGGVLGAPVVRREGREPGRLRVEGQRVGSTDRGCVSPDGHWAATYGDVGLRFGWLRLWDLERCASILALTDQPPARELAIDPTSARVAVRSRQQIEIRGLPAGEVLATIAVATGDAAAMRFSPDGGRLAVWESGRAPRLFVVSEAAAAPTVLHASVGDVTRLEFDPNGERLVTVGATGIVRMWDARSGGLLADLVGHGSAPPAERLPPVRARNPIGRLAQALGRVPRSLGTGLRGATALVTSVAFSPNGRWLVTTGVDHTTRVWDAADGAPVATLHVHDSLPTVARFLADSTTLAIVEAVGELLVIEVSELGDSAASPAAARARLGRGADGSGPRSRG
ncbi:MAG: TIR domain-containing protein [Planctomycetes bacterium]|nr:TIR domain-containing protein [Planctomycetota bacterium]